jgi:chromosome segregation ATPase
VALESAESRSEVAAQSALEGAQVLEQRSSAFVEERENLETDLQRLRVEGDERDKALLAEQRVLESQLAGALQRTAQSEKALGVSEQARHTAETYAANAETEADNALGEVALAQGEVSRIESELNRLRGETDAAREHVALREQEVTELQKQVGESQNELDQAAKELNRSESDYGDIFGKYTLQQMDLLNLEIDAKEAKAALKSALDKQKSLLPVHEKRMASAEDSYAEIVDGLMDLVQVAPDSSDLIFGLLEKLRAVLDAGQEVVETNRRQVEAEL